ncbi:MAG: endonuclease/exonuclease/phosphatase family protein, partial [Gammaproteobacteria bacterium]|nr:endonuclease/exonuclease/phosphatase family protein [Gammaproteobacteria bacterium]
MRSPVKKEGHRFRVLSFNIRGGGHAPYYLGARRPKNGPGIGRIGQDILTHAIDLVGLQEVFHVAGGTNGSRHHLTDVFRKERMDVSWGRATSLATPIAVGNMNVINTSIFEVIEHSQIVLAGRLATLATLGLNRLFDYRQRCAQHSLLRFRTNTGFYGGSAQNCTHINFVNVHLDFSARRRKEGRLLCQYIERFRDAADHTILVGDFNEEPNGEVVNRILECGFLDSMDGSDLLTFRQAGGDLRLKPQGSSRRIDYVFFTPGNQRGGSSTMEMQ